MNSDDVPAGIAATEEITLDELQLAARNHGMPLEALGYDITPLGMHYILTHFDIPALDKTTWTIQIDGLVGSVTTLTMQDLRSRPAVTITVTMECAGNGRARLRPRPLSQPWLNEAVGTAEWTGTPLAPILLEARVNPEAVELVFQGADRGIQGEVEQDYERSLSVADAMRDEVLLVYEMGGQPLPPQHGFPVRLLVPGWYGMTSVKWLRRITAVSEPFDGFQMYAYKVRQRPEDEGDPVTRIRPRALMIPPGFPEFFTRTRILDAGVCRLAGKAWSGSGPVERVEVSTDGGTSWSAAEVGTRVGPFAWTSWSFDWEASAGEHELLVRATDAAGETQPVDQPWNHHGLTNTMAQRVRVTVR